LIEPVVRNLHSSWIGVAVVWIGQAVALLRSVSGWSFPASY
jgi:hypothetical protein